jgi:BolA protein
VSRQAEITRKLSGALEPVHLDVVNESSMHSVPPGSETHFKVVVVSSAFEGMGPVDRHRRVNAALVDEFASGLHALAIVALTPAQWAERGGAVPASPPCLGGSKQSS